MGQGDAAADWNRQRWLALITGRGSECQVHTWGHPPAEAPGNEVDPARLTAAVPGRCHRGQIPSVAVAAGRTGLWVWTGAPPSPSPPHTRPPSPTHSLSHLRLSTAQQPACYTGWKVATSTQCNTRSVFCILTTNILLALARLEICGL